MNGVAEAIIAATREGNRERMRAHGFDDYVTRPSDGDAFLATIEVLLYGDH